MNIRIFGATICVVALAAGSASAHHSGAMFDTNKTDVFDNAVVKEFEWTNPHAWLQVVVPSPRGENEWSLELTALVGLQRAGWKHGTLKPGDKVKVSMNPMRDGTRGGRLLEVTLADGTVLNGQGRAVQPKTAVNP